MTTKKLLIGILFISALFSCDNDQDGEVIYEETFNINDLTDDTQVADEEFINKYSDFISNTLDLYSFENSRVIQENSSFKSEYKELNQSIEFEFDLSTDSTKYYILNNLSEFNNSEDVEIGWSLGEAAFWSSLLNHTKKEDFKYYRNQTKYSMGDLSEYSELPIGNLIMLIYHIKWNNFIIQYSQIINLSLKETYMKKIEDNFSQLKKGL